MPDQFKIFDEVDSFSRTERIATQIKKCLAKELAEFFKSFGGGMLTITDVVLSSDRKQAKVYLSFYGVKKDSDTITNAINDNAYRFQSLLGSSLKLKRTPVLKFFKKGSF